jgi:hypothetical protein
VAAIRGCICLFWFPIVIGCGRCRLVVGCGESSIA